MPKKFDRNDGWSSILSGMGVKGRDKNLDFNAVWERASEADLENSYSSDDVCGRIVDEICEDGTRSWSEYLNCDDDQEAALQALENKLDCRIKFREGWRWSRLYGGAAIIVNTNLKIDEMNRPLNLKTEGGEIVSLTVVNSFELIPADGLNLTIDVSSTNYGLPDMYKLQSRVGQKNVVTLIHHSRVFRFEGKPLPRLRFRLNRYWHDSVLTKSMGAIRNYNIAHDSAALTASDFSVPVIKMKGLADMVRAGKGQLVQDRLNIIKTTKSMLSMVLIDESEELDHLTRSVSGLSEIIKATQDRLVMSTKMPRTKILGESPGGLGSNGNSEDRSWYDLVEAERGRVIDPPYTRLFNLLLEQLGLPQTISYKFSTLWQQSDKEKADAYKVFAEADHIYLQDGVVSQKTVQESRFGGELFGTEINLSDDDKIVDSTQLATAQQVALENKQAAPPVAPEQPPKQISYNPNKTDSQKKRRSKKG